MTRENLKKAQTNRRYLSNCNSDTSVLVRQPLGEENHKGQGYLLNPNSGMYEFWWYFTTVCSIVTGFFTPWEVAFSKQPGLSPYNDANAMVEYYLSLVFLIDILVLFNLPQPRNDGLLETSRKGVALRYLRSWFAIDLLGVVPFCAIVGTVWGPPSTDHVRVIGLLRLLRLVRLRRLFTLSQKFETNLMFPLMVITLVRNIFIVVLVGHFAGCMFYFTSVFYGRDSDTWIGASRDIEDLTDLEKYIHSFYYSITTMTTVGYGDYSPKNTAEIVFATAYMIFNIVLNSYILGTITMVVIKADEKSGNLREMYGKLNYFSSLNHLGQEHTLAIKNYIRFHLDHPDLQDEDLFKTVPLGTRRMVLKSMYLPTLEKLNIFQGVSAGFLMRMLETAIVDIYTPNQQIIAFGDHVHELHTLLTGSVVCQKEVISAVVPTVSRIGEGQSFLIDKFFTMEDVHESITSETICRVLLIPRSSYLDACQEFPHDSMQMEINTGPLKRQYSTRFSMDHGQVSTPIVVAHGTGWDSDNSKCSPCKEECTSRASSSSFVPTPLRDQHD